MMETIYFIANEAIETDKRCLKVAGKRFIFGPSSINHFPCKIDFILDPSLKFKNCTLEGALFRPRIFRNPANCAYYKYSVLHNNICNFLQVLV